jgi:hypothetical protein
MKMFKIKNANKRIFWIIGLIILVGLTGCAPGTPEVETPISQTEVETVVPAATEAQETPPVVESPPKALLVTGDGVDPFVFNEIQILIETLTSNSGLSLDVLPGTSPEMVTPDVQVVIGVGANLDFSGFAASAPGVSFVAIGDPTATVMENLSVIGDPADETRQQAFMAGYLSALTASDSKVAAIISSDHPASDLLAESFVVGARFFCGICQPLYPPYNPFPQWELLPVVTTADGFRPLINTYGDMEVEVLYVHGDLVSPDLLVIIQDLGIKVVSDRTPDVIRDNWVGTITIDPIPALKALWPDVVAGMPGKQVPAAIRLTNRDPELLSDGRYRLFEEMAADIQAGLVSFERVP